MHSFLTNIIPDLPNSPDTLHIHPEKSIGIEEIRTIQLFLSKKPIQSLKNSVIIHQAHLLTLPAQHAFLKTLEEPPSNSQIYLVTDFPDQLLPTVLSRCALRSPAQRDEVGSYFPKSLDLFRQLLANGVEDRLKLLDDAKFTRDTALQFFNDCEIIIHSYINHTTNLPPLNLRGGQERVIFSLISQSKLYLKSNVNLKLILDNLAINITDELFKM